MIKFAGTVYNIASPGSKKGTTFARFCKAIKDEIKPTGTVQKNTRKNMAP